MQSGGFVHEKFGHSSTKTGCFLLVADAYPVDKNRTRVQMFSPSIGYDVLIRAIKGWASGENLGCPDMTKI